MEQTLFGVQELSERWNISPGSVRNMEAEGKLHRVPNIPGVRYSAAEVFQLESVGLDAEALSVYERRRLQNEVRQLKEENEDLKQRLMTAQRVLMGVTA